MNKKVSSFLLTLLSFATLLSYGPMGNVPEKKISLMLEPAGDAKYAGRSIDDCFERGITLLFAEALKKTIEAKQPAIRVILSRFPGESVEPLQNAHFANRLAVNLYISIHCFEAKEEHAPLFIYYFSYQPSGAFGFPVQQNILSFIPYDQAHLHWLRTTTVYAQHIVTSLQHYKEHVKYLDIQGPFAFPFKPLIGINTPALAIEVGLKTKKHWEFYVEPLAQSIISLFTKETEGL